MTVQAQSADGVLHSFPDGTDPGVIDRVMKAYAMQAAPKPAAAAAPAPQAQAAAPSQGIGRPPSQQPATGEYLGNPRVRALMRRDGVAPDPTAPTRFALGAASGVVGLGAGLTDLAAKTGLVSSAGADGAASSLQAARERLKAGAGIKGTDVAGVAGELASPVNFLVPGSSLARMTAQGALSGFSQPATGAGGHLANAGTGAAVALGLGAAGKAASAGVGAIVRAVAPSADVTTQRAVAKVAARFEQDAAGGGPSATQAIAAVNEARARGTPMALADAGGKNVQGLAGSLARAPGEPKALAEQAAKAQMEQAGKRLSDFAATHISSGGTMRQSVDALTAGQKAAATPLYTRAFNTGSTAPLIPSLQKRIAEAGQKEAQAMEDVRAVQAAVTAPPAKLPKSAPSRIGPSLLEWISKRGGVMDPGGDLRSMGADRWHIGKPGKKPLLIDGPDAGSALPGMGKSGTGYRDDKGLDDVARAAWEEGYLPHAERPDTNALLDAVGEELGGSKVHTAEDQITLRQRDEAARYADFVEGHKETARAAAEELGSTLTKSEEHHAAELIAQGTHPHEAVQDAEIGSRNERSIRDENRSRMAYQKAKLEKAQAAIGQAKQDRAAATEAMRQAQADAAAGKRGGVWSPRIQQIITDPIAKPAIARGLEIMRLEALAEGRPFNPGEYAITGAGPDGQPVVAKVPNMRLLDAVKRGMDAMVEDFRDPLTGKLNFMNSGDAGQKARAIDAIRRSYVAELDKVNPTYKAARAAWAGPAQAKGLVAQGRAIFRTHPEDVKKLWDRLTPSEREFYKIGVADWWRDEIAKAGPKSAAARGMSANDFNTMIKDRIRPIFDSEAKFREFVKAVTDERTVFEQAGRRLGGSQTADRLAEDDHNGLRAAGHLAAAGGKAVAGHPIGALVSLAKAKRDLGIIGDQRVNNAMARLLFSPDLDLNSAEGLALLKQVPSKKAPRYFESLRTAGAGAGATLALQGGPASPQ